MNSHLTDEHFADLLGGEELSTTAESHLCTCAPCRSELAALREAAGSFNQLSLVWAQAEAPRRIAPPSRFQRLLGRSGPVWALGLTSALAAGMVSTHLSGTSHTDLLRDTVRPGTTATAPSELAADNRLMQSIDDELQSSSQPAVPLDELRVASQRTAQPRTAALTN